MSSQLEEIISDFVKNVRQLSSFEAVHFEVAIGTYNHEVNWQYRCAGDLKLEGASMRNLKGEWIKSERGQTTQERERKMRNETTTQKFFELKRWDTGDVIHSGKFGDIKELVEDAVRKGISLFHADLRGADLRGTNLRGANLRGADLRGADLRGANLCDADLRGTDLPDTDFVTTCPWGNAHIQRNKIRIGWKLYTTEEWRNFTDDEINGTLYGALGWWKRWKTTILTIADACEQYEVKE